MDIGVWIIIFIAALIVLVKGADWLLDGAEKIGVAVGFSPFVVGVLLVGIGTSFPELVSSIAAVIKDVPEVVVANVVGSNIANILLVIGFAAIIARNLTVTKSLIDLDLPLVALSTVLFLGVVVDGVISPYEAGILILGYIIYFFYTVRSQHDEAADREDIVDVIPPPRYKKTIAKPETVQILRTPEMVLRNIGLLVIGGIALTIGAKYLIDSVIALSEILAIGTGTIALVAVAFGTSLPEVVVSIKAARQQKNEMVLGNVLGSNVFNVLVVVGIPGLFGGLHLDENTFYIGLPVMIVATILFIISGISRRIHNFEGMMYILIYILFITKLFGIL